jgi:hypothetical protein
MLTCGVRVPFSSFLSLYLQLTTQSVRITSANNQQFFSRNSNVADPAFANYVSLSSFSFGVEVPVPEISAGGGSGKPSVKTLTVSRRADIATPTLWRSLLASTNLQTVIIKNTYPLNGAASGANALGMYGYLVT